MLDVSRELLTPIMTFHALHLVILQLLASSFLLGEVNDCNDWRVRDIVLYSFACTVSVT